MGQRAVSPGAPHRDPHLVARRHVLPRAEPEAGRPEFSRRGDMLAHESPRRRSPGTGPRPAPATLRPGQSSSAGLEQPEHGPLDPTRLSASARAERSEQAGRVDVVPARVHHAPDPREANSSTGPLLDRQRIHVGPQHDATLRRSARALDPGQQRPFRRSGRNAMPASPSGTRPRAGRSPAPRTTVRDGHATPGGTGALRPRTRGLFF